MKKTTFTIALMSLILIFVGSVLGQENKRRAPRQIHNPIGLGGTVTAGVKNRKSTNLGDTGTHEVGHKGKRRQAPGFFRPNPAGDGTTQHFHTNANRSTSQYNPKELGIDKVQNQTTTAAIGEGASDVKARRNKGNARKAGYIKFDGIDGEVVGKKPNAAKYDGIDGESNNARTKKPNKPGKAQNLLPYLEQDNLSKTRNRKR